MYGTIFFVKKDMQQQQIMRFRFRFQFLGENIPKILSMCNSGFSTISVTRLKNTKMLISPELLDILAWNKHCYDCFQEVFLINRHLKCYKAEFPSTKPKTWPKSWKLTFYGFDMPRLPAICKKYPKLLKFGTKVWFISTMAVGNYLCDLKCSQNDGMFSHTYAGRG